MLLKAYSIRDQKSEVFNKPFFSNSHGEAERNFRTAANDDQTTIHRYPEDFDLYYLGDYDDNKGIMKPLDTPQHIAKAVSMNQSQKSPLKEAKQ